MPSGSDHTGSAVNPDTLVAVGVIRRAHGVRGEASVELLTDERTRFEELDRVFLVDPKRMQVVPSRVLGARSHQERVLVALEGIGSPEEVGLHRDWTIEIPEDEARALEVDEFFLHDLVGLAVHDINGDRIGVVVDTLEGVAQLRLRVEAADGGRFEIPFVKALCVDVDLDRGRLVVDLPEGLVDLNRGGK